MNSIPVLLLPLGEQPDTAGTGGKPPGTDDTAVGREAFLVILQHLLSGGALQDPATVSLPIAGDTTTGTETPVPCATAAAEGAAKPLRQQALRTERPLSLPAGGATQLLEVIGAGEGQPPGLQRPAAGSEVKSGSNAPALLQDARSLVLPDVELTAPQAGQAACDGQLAPSKAEPDVSEWRPSAPGAKLHEPDPPPRAHDAGPPAADVRPRLRETISVVPEPVDLPSGDGRVNDGERSATPPAARRPEAGETAGPPGAIREFVESRSRLRIVSRAPAFQAGAAASTIPVSGTEGDAQPARGRETAPAAMTAEGNGQSGEPTQELPGRLFQLAPTALGTPGAEQRADTQPGASGQASAVGADGKAEKGESGPSRDPAPDASKPVTIGASSPQERSPDEGTEQRGQNTHHAPVSIVPKGEVTGVREVRGEVPPAPVPSFRETAASVVDQVVKEFALRVHGERSELRIKLEPESLGEVVLRVRMESGKMQAQIEVAQAGVKTVLENSLPQLRLALHERGIDVQRFDVSFAGERPGNAFGDGNADRQRRQGSRRNGGADIVEYHTTGRLLGYNTMEMVM